MLLWSVVLECGCNHVALQLYSQCEQLLDVDAMAGSGVYRPDVPDPEMSCSSSTLLWELADLRVSLSYSCS
jgi:hypothetical protein